MAGYNNFSMSNNAVAAYDRGLCPASKIKGVPAHLVGMYCTASEWHHSSKQYNKVDFFDPAKVRAIFGLEVDPDGNWDADPAAVEALASHKAAGKPVGVLHTHCEVFWLEWGGTVKHPKATERAATGCAVLVKGQTATVTLPDGSTLVKRVATRGFSFTSKKS